ncbi:MAG: prepilin-type N-terminal cleavage/methylation domain-containing protein, partial [Alphaproteobacteria bacterium]
MKKIYLSEQTGRSMVEMLAVLAIVGILSVAGIAGYSKAMSKFKEQKLADQVSTLTANIRTAYSSQS